MKRKLRYIALSLVVVIGFSYTTYLMFTIAFPYDEEQHELAELNEERAERTKSFLMKMKPELYE